MHANKQQVNVDVYAYLNIKYYCFYFKAQQGLRIEAYPGHGLGHHTYGLVLTYEESEDV